MQGTSFCLAEDPPAQLCVRKRKRERERNVTNNPLGENEPSEGQETPSFLKD